MTSEFQLPCTECGERLVRGEIVRGNTTVTVAACPSCGSHHYPETALERL